jgi:predicted nucleic acid-binding protein
MSMKKLKIYMDTSLISILFDERSPEFMRWTREFWKALDKYDIYISDVTIAEIRETQDEELKEKMIKVIEGFNCLEIDEDTEKLADKYVEYGAVPTRYRRDALHIAIATVNHIEILVSWNYRHIVRRRTKEVVRMVNSMLDYPFIEIAAPPELLGGEEI